MKQFIREPLVHFLLLGAVLFGAARWIDSHKSGAAEKPMRPVVVTSNEVASLSETWARRMGRPPTQEELRGLVTDYLKEELLARQAREMGLGDNDTFIRRRLAQNLEFLVGDHSPLPPPTDAEMRAFYGAHLDLFRTPARISFTHIYFIRDARKDAAAEARGVLEQLLAQPDAAGLLKNTAELLNADEQTISAQFGKEFAHAVFALPPGGWHGPVESAYGFHLVRVAAVEPEKPRDFADAKPRALELWRAQNRRGVSDRYFAGLEQKYGVSVDESVKPLVGRLSGPLAEPFGGAGNVEPK